MNVIPGNLDAKMSALHQDEEAEFDLFMERIKDQGQFLCTRHRSHNCWEANPPYYICHGRPCPLHVF